MGWHMSPYWKRGGFGGWGAFDVEPEEEEDLWVTALRDLGFPAEEAYFDPRSGSEQVRIKVRLAYLQAPGLDFLRREIRQALGKDVNLIDRGWLKGKYIVDVVWRETLPKGIRTFIDKEPYDYTKELMGELEDSEDLSPDEAFRAVCLLGSLSPPTREQIKKQEEAQAYTETEARRLEEATRESFRRRLPYRL